MNRREFLGRGLAGVSIAATYPLFLGRTAAAVEASPPTDRVLVVLQLSGGNDGLSTVVPYSDPDYGRVRAATRIAESQVLRIDERMGLHPNLVELRDVYDRGELAIVQGASYPNPTRSHFEAMDVWHAGDPSGSRRGSGWLGRVVDSTCGNALNPVASVNLGDGVPLALAGTRSKPLAFRNPEAFRWRGARGAERAFSGINAPPRDMDGQGAEPLDYLRRVAADASSSSESIRRAAREYRAAGAYPRGNRLAEDLRLVAAMIASGIPSRIYYVSLGGFDTHANQRGRHDNLMRTVSSAVAAFLGDLRAAGRLDRVLVLAFSEFGRRVAENASRGTDHGVAAPLFLLGGRARGGLHGAHPSLTDLDRGDLRMTVDFRRVYSEVVEGWLGASADAVLGKRWEPLGLIRRADERDY